MACREVSKWMTEKVLVPVEKFITKAKKACESVKKKIEEKIQKPVEDWVSKQERKCKKQKCKWWCACCNKWFCWLVTVVVKVVTWVVVTIIKWVTHIVCKVVTVVIGTIVELVLKVITRLVTFFVCLFTDPLRALSALWDLFNDIIDAVEDLLDLILDLIEDIAEILGEFADLIGGIGRTFCIFGDVMCAIFGAIFGFFEGIVSWLADIVDWVHDTLEGLVDIVIGILSLDWCRIQKGLGVLNVLRVITSVTRLPGMAFWVGPKGRIDQRHLESRIDDALEEAFADDPERLDRSRERIGIDGSLLGVPMTLQPFRMAIRSSDFLRRLHQEGVLDLYAVAGRFSDCQGKGAWQQFEGEIVYTGTQTRVTKTDLDYFVEHGAESVASFTVYPISLKAFETRLVLTERKSRRVGVRFSSEEIDEVVVNDPRFVPLVSDEADNLALRDLLGLVGRTGRDDLAVVPILAIFGYTNTDLHGLAAWYRPERNDTGPSGVSFRDRFPEVVFQYVPPHEVGHYIGLDHTGHTHPGQIMWKPNLGTDWAPALKTYLLTSSEPTFTDDDIDAVWQWLTTTAEARDDILP